MAARARERRSVAERPNASSPISTLACTVSHGNSAKLWNTMATEAEGPVIGRPRQRTSPDTGLASPAMMRSKVLFPEPDRPSRPTISPAGTFRSMPSSTKRSEAPPPLKAWRTPATSSSSSPVRGVCRGAGAVRTSAISNPS